MSRAHVSDDTGWDNVRSKTGALLGVIGLLAAFGGFWTYHGVRALVEVRPLYALFYLPAALGCFVIPGLTVFIIRQRRVGYTASRSAVVIEPGRISFALSGVLRWGYWTVFGLTAFASTTLAVGMWSNALQFPMSGGFEAALPFVSLILAVYAVLALMWLRLGYARLPQIDCTSIGIGVQGFKARQEIQWSEVASVERVGINNLSVRLAVTEDSSARVVTNWVGPLSPDQHELGRTAIIAADLFAIGAEQLFSFLQFYVENDWARDELADQRAVGRLRLR